MSNVSIDDTWEFNAPRFVDFDRQNHEESRVDEWFGKLLLKDELN